MRGTDRSADTRHSGDYSDIIDHERPVSDLFAHMPMKKRAAQFSPFKALTGYDEAVTELGKIHDEVTK